MPATKIETVNVRGEDWDISGATTTDVPAEGSTQAFSAGGAYSYFLDSETKDSFLGKVYGRMLGLNWTRTSLQETINNIIFNNGKFYAATAVGIYYSTDGFHWYPIASTVAYNVRKIITDGNSYLALFYTSETGSVVYYSADGNTWVQSDPVVYADDIAGHDSVWIAVSSSEGIFRSTDGFHWSPVITKRFSYCAYGHNVFVALSRSSMEGAYFSYDGLEWESTNLGTGYDFEGLAYANGVFFTVSHTDNSYGEFYFGSGTGWDLVGMGSPTESRDDLKRAFFTGNYYILVTLTSFCWLVDAGRMVLTNSPIQAAGYANGLVLSPKLRITDLSSPWPSSDNSLLPIGDGHEGYDLVYLNGAWFQYSDHEMYISSTRNIQIV